MEEVEDETSVFAPGNVLFSDDGIELENTGDNISSDRRISPAKGRRKADIADRKSEIRSRISDNHRRNRDDAEITGAEITGADPRDLKMGRFSSSSRRQLPDHFSESKRCRRPESNDAASPFLSRAFPSIFAPPASSSSLLHSDCESGVNCN